MKNREWDDALRRRARDEMWKLTPEAEARFQDAAARGRREAARPRAERRRRLPAFAWLVAAECALALLLILWPARDRVRGPLPAAQDVESMQPVTQGQQALAPRVDLYATLLEGQEARAEGRFANETDEIWLVEWFAQLEGEQPRRRLLWLEPGASCEDATAWGTARAGQTLQWSYRGYRVTADVLHWLDGDPLTPGDEEYAAQQELLEAAFEAEALILAPGDWPGGQAGEMDLLLPDAYLAEHPGESPLGYYLDKGMVEAAFDLCQGEGSVTCCAPQEAGA